MTDKERKEIFEHRADRAAWNVKLMSYTAFKCALADAERRFMESADQIHPIPSIPTHYGDGVASDQTDMVGAEAWDAVEGIIGKCTCDVAYVSRKMTDPNCSWCDYHVDLIEAMHRFASIQVEKVRKARKEKDAEIAEKEIIINESMEALSVGLRAMIDRRKKIEALESDLSAAQSRIAFLEKELAQSK